MNIRLNKKCLLPFLFVLVIILNFAACKEEKSKKNISSGAFIEGKGINVPLIAWGADLVTIFANGISDKTIKGSLFDEAGLHIQLFREDNFNKQVELYISGKIVFLRGTMGMMNMASEKLNSNPTTRPVLIYQHSWSAGGDALVVKKGINSITDLKGKTVAIQNSGPHVDYFLKLIKDAQLKPTDVTIVWTKDLVGAKGDTPMVKLQQSNIDAAFVIIPDALALTSNGTVGTGAEDSVKGARILLSTKTANRIIADVYAVRKDYFDKNKTKVEKFVAALLKAEEQVKDLLKNPNSDECKKLLSMGGKLLLDDPRAITDVKGMYSDADMSGFNDNVKFFADANYPRNYQQLSNEIQASLIGIGLLSNKSTILTANWDYNSLKQGLKYANAVRVSKFNPEQMPIIAQKYSKSKKGSLFSFEIYFQPNQNEFSANTYSSEFDRVINFASTYGGALVTVEGHSDPMGYLRKEKSGANPILLKKIKQAAKNLSYSRANAVKDAILKYATGKGITLDTNQINIIGYGIESPKYAVPKSQDEWKQNMRVQFKIIQVEVEEKAFRPL